MILGINNKMRVIMVNGQWSMVNGQLSLDSVFEILF